MGRIWVGVVELLVLVALLCVLLKWENCGFVQLFRECLRRADYVGCQVRLLSDFTVGFWLSDVSYDWLRFTALGVMVKLGRCCQCI